MLFVSRWENELSSTRHRDLHPLRLSSIQFVSRLDMGVRGRSLSSYIVAVIFVNTLGDTSSPVTTLSPASPAQPARLRKNTKIEGQQALKQGVRVVRTWTSTIEREEEKLLVKYATRTTLPGMSRVIETGEETFISDKRILRLLYIYFH